MTSPRRVTTSAALAAVITLAMATVVLAAPAVAEQWAGQAHGYRFRAAPQQYADSFGSPYGGSYGPSYDQQTPQQQSPEQQAPSQQEQVTASSAVTGLDTSPATPAQESGLVRIATVVEYGEAKAAGTGIVVSSNGVVVTNHHVVQGATRIRVTVLSTGRTYTARVVGSSTKKDVAVLKLRRASGLTTASTDATAVQVGESVTAVGDAAGKVQTLTAAAGTVTARSRSITVSDEQTGAKHRLRHLIEVSSDVIPGDSGGALRATDGDVVGMTVAASSGTTSATVNGYIIPWSRVAEVEREVLAGQTTGDLTLGYAAFLGVELDSRTDTTAVAGVVKHSPAAAAGLTTSDTITSVGGTPTSTATALRAAIATYVPGDVVAVTWTDTAGTSHTADVTLTKAPIA